jgi:REP element-mobilizing transposase RayT
MPRPPRELVPSGLYHVIGRGTGGAHLFRGAADRRHFLTLLGRAVGRFRWSCFAYCLLGTHYHLLVETPEPNLDRGMHALLGPYAQAFNRRHGRFGHLVAERYTALLVDGEQHVLGVFRYIALNPVSAGLCKAPEQWAWSSYGATIGLRTPPSFLETERVIGWFGRPPAAQRRMRALVDETSRSCDGV